MTGQATFRQAGPRSHKVACSVCGATGYDYPGAPWQERHLAGHIPCGDCGRPLTVLYDGSPRKHARCPARQPSS